MKTTHKFKVGDRVLMLEAKYWADFENRSHYGRISRINGGYYYVRPMRGNWGIECYENELELAN